MAHQHNQPPTDPLAAGFAALARADWATGLADFQAALLDGESAEAHEGLAMAAWWLDDVATIFASRERAYRLYRQHNSQVDAARVAIWIALDHYIYRDEPAITEGWLQRARRLLVGQPPAVEHGWLAIWSGHIALIDHNDVDAARRLGAQALKLGRSLGNADLEALALALEGLAMVSAGDVDEGMHRLDEATTAAVSGDVSDYDAIATICCYLIFACERVRDYDRAAQWCAKVEEVSLGCDYRSMFPVCRTHYAAVLIWRGDWQQAEDELIEAARRLASSRRGWAPDSIVRLAELRRRQGRLDEAAELFEQAARDARSLLGLAEMALDRRDLATATDLTARFLRRVPAADRTERAVGLALDIRIRLAHGETDAASASLREIEATAAQVGTDPLQAMARLAGGLVAEAACDREMARAALEDAVDLFERSGAPYEMALARVDLARVLDDAGRQAVAIREARTALATLDRLGARPAAQQARTLLQELEAGSDAESRAMVGLSRRETDVLRLLAQGASNQQIADALFISIRTVERHVSTIYEKLGVTGPAARAATTAWAIAHGLTTPQQP